MLNLVTQNCLDTVCTTHHAPDDGGDELCRNVVFYNDYHPLI